ncbi:MAG: fibrinogen-like YCDxxxxGGGW domain-containing protein [Enhygromyxa sp.]
MSSNTALLTGSLRIATLVALALPLACFTADDSDSNAEGEDTQAETDTGGPCEIATEGCPCTAGGGCNPGLECVDGVCNPAEAVCGNGSIEPGEACDDANDDNTDNCTTLCQPPSCDDGIKSGAEVDVDCGMEACGIGCDFGQACLGDLDCKFPLCGPAPGGGEDLLCELPRSCKNWLEHNPGATDNTYTIDPDGAAGPIPAMEVFCHMSKDGGGWTLVFVASDDDVDTWTWNTRTKMANDAEEVGTLLSRNLDFMSRAYYQLPFTDVLFIHQPSNVWAEYANVGDGTKTMGAFVSSLDSPVCNYEEPGFPLTAGTLTDTGLLCDTNLYFNLGDHETSLAECMIFGQSTSTAFGPAWSADKGDGCPFDDPAEFGLGPHSPCGVCPNNFPSTEFDYLGYANALSLNSGAKKAGENYMQMYVR